MNICAVIVIYNKGCDESKAVQCLKNIEGIKMVIADNSTQEYRNGSRAGEQGWQYINMGGNKGLAKAYNRAIDDARDTDALICLFDDDAAVDRKYFESLEEAALREPGSKVFLPLVYDAHGLKSPCMIKGYAVKRVNSLSGIPPGGISGINNGMAIRKEVFESYRYDEGYFLDYIDHDFLRSMKRLGSRISVFDARLEHDMFFESGDGDLDGVAVRFSIFKRDFSRFCGRSLKGRCAYHLGIIRQLVFFLLRYGRIGLILRLMFIKN